MEAIEEISKRTKCPLCGDHFSHVHNDIYLCENCGLFRKCGDSWLHNPDNGRRI